MELQGNSRLDSLMRQKLHDTLPRNTLTASPPHPWALLESRHTPPKPNGTNAQRPGHRHKPTRGACTHCFSTSGHRFSPTNPNPASISPDGPPADAQTSQSPSLPSHCLPQAWMETNEPGLLSVGRRVLKSPAAWCSRVSILSWDHTGASGWPGASLPALSPGR